MQLKLKYNLVKVTHCHKKGKKICNERQLEFSQSLICKNSLFQGNNLK